MRLVPTILIMYVILKGSLQTFGDGDFQRVSRVTRFAGRRRASSGARGPGGTLSPRSPQPAVRSPAAPCRSSPRPQPAAGHRALSRLPPCPTRLSRVLFKNVPMSKVSEGSLHHSVVPFLLCKSIFHTTQCSLVGRCAVIRWFWNTVKQTSFRRCSSN